MKTQKIVVLGSTGSIGTQTLEVVRQHGDKLQVLALSAHRNWKLLADQVNEFHPKYAILGDENYLPALRNAIGHSETECLLASSLPEIASLPEADVIVNALVGFAGFSSTYEALKSGKRVALANKESLVVGGPLLESYCGREKDQLLPVDSEHSAILQCLVGERDKDIEQLIITASGGPFRDTPLEDFPKITVSDALKHPNWEMGAKITIDSATMMNKGLEVIEAKWLFNIPLEKIEAVIHPQSIIHSMVTFADGSTKAQLGHPDMKVPIQYALSYPVRWPLETPRMNWSEIQKLDFRPVDYQRFPCFKLAMDALKEGSHAPAILNAANEVAVQRFLDKEIGYIHISKLVEQTLNRISNATTVTVTSLYETDTAARDFAQSVKL